MPVSFPVYPANLNAEIFLSFAYDLQHQPNPGSGRTMAIATLKALEYVLKFVVRSRQLVYAPSSPALPTSSHPSSGPSSSGPSSSGPPSSGPSSVPSVPVAAEPVQFSTDTAARFAAIKADPQFQSDLLDVFSALNQLMRLKGKTYHAYF